MLAVMLGLLGSLGGSAGRMPVGLMGMGGRLGSPGMGGRLRSLGMGGRLESLGILGLASRVGLFESVGDLGYGRRSVTDTGLCTGLGSRLGICGLGFLILGIAGT